MGLSTLQVSGDGLDWGQSLLQSGALELPELPPARRQQQRQQSEPLACPRCGSTNTKFCYYNNYNKSQPRHFCKACKRHWTKGGTLRNVPVGGGRKHKRIKRTNTSTATISSSSTSSNSRSNTHLGKQSQPQCQNLPLALGDQKNISEILYHALIRPSASSQHDSLHSPANFNADHGDFLGSTLPLLQNQTPPFTFSSLCSFESNQSSISTSFRSSDDYSFPRGLASMEDTTITTIMPTATSIASQPWQVPTASSVMDMPNYWNWDDIDSFVSTDLNIPWDDIEVKP